MSKFVRLIEETRHGIGGSLWVNIEQIIAVHVASHTIHTSAPEVFQITKESMQCLINEIKK